MKPITLENIDNKALSELVKVRRQLIDGIRRHKNYAEHDFFTKAAKNLNKRMLKKLEQELGIIEDEIRRTIKDDEQIKMTSKRTKLRSC